VVAHHLDEAGTVHALGAEAGLEIGRELLGVDGELAEWRARLDLIAKGESRHAIEHDEIALARLLEVRDAAKAADLAEGYRALRRFLSGFDRLDEADQPVGRQRMVHHRDITRFEHI